MPTINIATVNLERAELQAFFDAFKAFMGKEVRPGFVGVAKLDYEIRFVGDLGFEILVKTNRKLNIASTQMIRLLARGFSRGWQARVRQTEESIAPQG